MKRKRKPVRAPRIQAPPPPQPPADWPLWEATICTVHGYARGELSVLVAATSWCTARATAQRFDASSFSTLKVDRYDGPVVSGRTLLWIEPDPCAPFGHLRVTRTP